MHPVVIIILDFQNVSNVSTSIPDFSFQLYDFHAINFYLIMQEAKAEFN